MVIDSYNTPSEINGFFIAVEDIMPAAIPVVGNKKLQLISSNNNSVSIALWFLEKSVYVI